MEGTIPSPEASWGGQGRLALAGIVLFTVAVHFPALGHTVRSDQVHYLAHHAGDRNWFRLALGTYAYERVRRFDPGDELLFRPVQHFLLGTELALFGYHFWAWQTVGLLLHVAVVCALHSLLVEIRRGPWAPLLTVLFSTLFMPMDMAIWHHLHGYLLFALLFLLGLKEVLHHLRTPRPERRRSVRLVAIALVAVFTHEFGVMVSILWAAFLLRARWPEGRDSIRRAAPVVAALYAIPLLYMTCSALDFVGRSAQAEEGSRILGRFSALHFLETMALMNVLWFSGIFPFLVHRPWAERGQVFLLEVPGIPDRWTWLPYAILPALLALFLVRLAVRRWRSNLEGRRLNSFAGLMALSLFAFEAILSVGRYHSRGLGYVTENPYYSYFFWVVLLIVVHALVTPDAAASGTRPRRGLIVAGFLVAGLTLVNAVQVASTNLDLGRLAGPRNALIRQTEQLIEAHGRETGFSFSVAGDHPDNTPTVLSPRGGPYRRRRLYTLIELLFPEHFRDRDARYVIPAPSPAPR